MRGPINPHAHRRWLDELQDAAEHVQPQFLQHVVRVVLVAERLRQVISQRPIERGDQVAERFRIARLVTEYEEFVAGAGRSVEQAMMRGSHAGAERFDGVS